MPRSRHTKRIPELPLEVKALITEQLGLERDLTALRRLRAADSHFAYLAIPFIFRHLDFRGKSLPALEIFRSSVASRVGPYVQSITHRPVDAEAIAEINSPKAQLDALFSGDRMYSNIFRNFNHDPGTHVLNLDLTVPSLQYVAFFGNTMGVMSKWKSLRHLTLRAAAWGRGGFDSASLAFNGRIVGDTLKTFEKLETLRCLGISGLDLSSDGPSLASLRQVNHLNISALHLAGGWLAEWLPHFVRLAPPLTHLIIAEDTEIDISELSELMLAVGSTLESIAIRQAGFVTDDTGTCPDFLLSDLPRLQRLAIVLNEDVLMPLQKFRHTNIKILELGSEGEGQLEGLCGLLEKGCWTQLKELAFSSLNIDGEAWSRVHGVCESRSILFQPGFSTDYDMPMIV